MLKDILILIVFTGTMAALGAFFVSVFTDNRKMTEGSVLASSSGSALVMLLVPTMFPPVGADLQTLSYIMFLLGAVMASLCLLMAYLFYGQPLVMQALRQIDNSLGSLDVGGQ